MPVSAQVDPSNDLTIFVGVGSITKDEIIEAVRAFYGQKHTMKVLWDLREADSSGLSSENVKQIAEVLNDYGGAREGVQTAIVTPVNVTYGLSRMLISYLDSKEPHLYVPMNVFSSLEAAQSWLGTTWANDSRA
jgi:hypothetical protein